MAFSHSQSPLCFRANDARSDLSRQWPIIIILQTCCAPMKLRPHRRRSLSEGGKTRLMQGSSSDACSSVIVSSRPLELPLLRSRNEPTYPFDQCSQFQWEPPRTARVLVDYAKFISHLWLNNQLNLWDLTSKAKKSWAREPSYRTAAEAVTFTTVVQSLEFRV